VAARFLEFFKDLSAVDFSLSLVELFIPAFAFLLADLVGGVTT
jgi:hypothetical protein